MYTLYYAPGTASMLVHLTLLECDAPHALQRVDLEHGEQRGAAYRSLNPAGTVPTLIVDGHAHGEAAALAMLLAERHPGAALAPAVGEPGRAAYLSGMLDLANMVQPCFRQWFYPQDFNADGSDARRAAEARLDAAWTRLDARLAAHGPYLLGERFSVLDLYATMLMRWSRNMPRPATVWPHLAALAARVKARPSWRRVNDIEGLTDWP